VRDYREGNRIGYNMISLYLYLPIIYIYIYIYIDIIIYAEHVMVFWNLLNGRSSRSRPLLEPSKSMQGGTNPRQQPPSSWQVSRC
jgi:hypothetical protein